MPDAAGSALIGAEGRQAGRDVGDVAVGVWQVRVADEVGAFAGDGVGEDPLAERRPGGDAGTEEVRRPPDRDPDAARLGGREQLLGHRRPGSALDGRGGEREIFGHLRACGRAVAIEVLQAHQQRTVRSAAASTPRCSGGKLRGQSVYGAFRHW